MENAIKYAVIFASIVISTAAVAQQQPPVSPPEANPRTVGDVIRENAALQFQLREMQNENKRLKSQPLTSIFGGGSQPASTGK